MAKPISTKRPAPLPFDKDIPQIQVDEPVYFSPPKGLDTTSRLSRVSKEFCADIKNLILDDGTLRSRHGVQLHSGVFSGDIMSIVAFIAPNGKGYLIRTTTTSLQRWNGISWDTVAADVFHGGLSDYFSFTSFGFQLIIANGIDKLYYYDLFTSAHGYIDESFPAKHITSFNGRVVASFTTEGERKPYRIRWSVKNDSFDWTSAGGTDLTGEGAGFEDLFATPGGSEVDTAHGVYPLSDDTALIIREDSVWQMSVTGNLLVPHRFTRVFAEMGTRARRSIAMIPGGVIYVTRDNVVAISTSEIRRIGDRVRNSIIDSITDWDAVVGKYDAKRMEYRLAVGNTVWRYSFREDGWTKDVYPFNIRDMNTVEIFKSGLPIDQLPTVGATIDDLPGVIDDLVRNLSITGFFFVGY